MKHILKHRFKPRRFGIGLGLMLTALCFGQVSYAGAPHNVIYWDGQTGNGSLNKLIYSDYTDVIVSFVDPDPNCNLGSNGNLPYDIASSIQMLHNAGKTVLVSLGGYGVPSGNYAACDAGPEPGESLAYQLTQIVKNNGFDGVDIDFEDSSAFMGQASYDGVSFLTALTASLHSLLPQWSIITHAPQTPYWLPGQGYAYNTPPYALINSNVGGYIAWYNNQTYNQCPRPANGTDCTAQQKMDDYNSIIRNVLGGYAQKLVMGFAVGAKAADSGGVIPLTNNPGYDVQTVITQLEQTYPNHFGGVMGWDYSYDLSQYGGNWGSAVAGGLSDFPPSNWTGVSIQTGRCLVNNNGAVSAGPCTGGNWRFFVNQIRDARTNQCLDSNSAGNVYVDGCNGGNNQNWEFYGYVIFDRATRLCLQSDSNGNVSTAPCDVNNPYEMWW